MNLTELEQMVRAMGMEMARKLLTSRLEEDPRADPDGEHLCPQCQWKLRIPKKSRAQHRELATNLGPVHYRRAYGICDRCGFTGAPLDRALGIPHSGPSVAVLQKVSAASVLAGSFEKGTDFLGLDRDIPFCRQYVRKLAEGEGKKMVAEQKEQIQLYQNHKLEIRSEQRPGLLVIGADGGRVQTLQPVKEERWKEDKIGVVYDAQPVMDPAASFEDYQGAKAETKTYVATMEPWDHLGWLVRLEAERRGLKHAKEILFLSDGAEHVREVQRNHFPEAGFILDWCHAAGHLSASSKAAFGESEQAQRWYQTHKTMLWEGKSDELIADLRGESDRVGHPEKADTNSSPRVILYRDAYSYFPNNREAIDYPAFRSKGWPLGSGVTEGAVKQFNLRMKGSDKSWNVSNMGAEEMLALCAHYHSEDGRWDRYWKSRAQPR